MTGTLHTYQCSNCKTVATTPAKTESRDLQCVVCRRWMRHIFTQPIDTLELQALADRGLVFNPHIPAGASTKRPCANCRTRVEKASMIDLGAAGRYCSQSCADEGSEKHRQAMERVDAGLEELYQRKPYLRPIKESA